MGVPELLAPAGGWDAVCAALAAGADAIYTGLGELNARAASAGLSVRELERASALAHGRGARIYVTLNSLVGQGEFERACELGRLARDAGADALIVADTGLARSLMEELPGFELHLSTQSGVHSASGALLAARELGCSRVTVGRELSVAEISSVCAAGVPVEMFCHGAICICYSGACAFSALRRGRSANRGDCTQPCRTNYALEDGGGRVLAGGPEGVACGGDRLLCPRDNLGIGHVGELARAGVAAFKIEGRMKNPDYVYNTVSCYREALDAVAEGRGCDAAALTRRLELSFNRGFTDAYLRGGHGAGLGAGFMSFERSSNQGSRAGVLVEQRGDDVVVELERAVDAGDMLEIRSTPGEHAAQGAPKRWPQVPCSTSGRPGERLQVHCKRRVEPGSAVHVVRSARLLAEAEEAVRAVKAEAGEVGCNGGGRADGGGLRSRTEDVQAGSDQGREGAAGGGPAGVFAGGRPAGGPAGAVPQVGVQGRRPHRVVAAVAGAMAGPPPTAPAALVMREAPGAGSEAEAAETDIGASKTAQAAGFEAEAGQPSVLCSPAGAEGVDLPACSSAISDESAGAVFAVGDSDACSRAGVAGASEGEPREDEREGGPSGRSSATRVTVVCRSPGRARAALAGEGFVEVAAPEPPAETGPCEVAVHVRHLLVGSDGAALDGAVAGGIAKNGVTTVGIDPAWEDLLPRLAVILDETARERDEELLRAVCARAGAVVCRNLGQVDAACAAGVPWEAAAPLSVWNAESARWLAGLGARRIWLPDELSVEDACAIAQAVAWEVPLGVMLRGRPQLMVTEHCLLTAEGPCAGECASCPRRVAAAQGDRLLVDADGARLPVEVDPRGRTRIFDAAPLDRAASADELLAAGVSSFLVDIVDKGAA